MSNEEKDAKLKEVSDYLSGEGFTLDDLKSFQTGQKPAVEGDAGIAASNLAGTGPAMNTDQLSQKFYELDNFVKELTLKIDNLIHEVRA